MKIEFFNDPKDLPRKKKKAYKKALLRIAEMFKQHQRNSCIWLRFKDPEPFK